MSGFDITVIVDWSGGNDTGPTPRKDAIWAGVAGPGEKRVTRYFRNRRVFEEWFIAFLDEELGERRRVFAGFDFPFGYPAGFGRALTGSDDPFAVWDWFEMYVEDSPKANNRFELAGRINARFPGIGPFWFRPPSRDIPDLPMKGSVRRDHGQTEWRRAERTTKGTFSCWQLGGAGAVGSQVMMGLPMLNRLRRRYGGALGVWPFQKGDFAIHVVEVWPSLIARVVAERLTEGAIKDEVQVGTLAEAIHNQPAERMARWLAQGDPVEGAIFASDDPVALAAPLGTLAV